MSDLTSKHILHIAKRRIVPPKEIGQMSESNGHKNTFIGALPYDIITNISREQISTVTQRTNEIFSGFARSVSYIYIDKHEHYSLANEPFKRYFPQITHELNSLFNRNDISVSYIGSGTYKHCFVLSFGKKSQNRYVLQAFQNVINVDSDYPHGVLFEPQNCFTAYKKYSHGRFARPFMSHPSNMEILSGGYILTKYIDSKHVYKKSLGKFVQRRTGATNTDILNANNNVRGITVDAGGFTENPEHITTPQIRYHWHELAQILDNINFSILDKDIYSSLYKRYIKYGAEFFDTMRWPKLIKKFPAKHRDKTRRILKSLRRLKIKCEKLSLIPDWQIVQNYIIKDMHEIYPRNYKTQTFFPEIIFDIIGMKQR